MLGALLEVELLKKCRCCGATHFQVKMLENISCWEILEVELLKKCAPLWREACSQLKSVKN